MIRPAIYQAVTRILIGVVLSLLWSRFIDKGARSLLEYAFFTMGAIFFALAWMQYLKLDGISVRLLLGKKGNKKKKPIVHSMHDIADFTDEKIVSFDELEETEKTICLFCANLAAALFFLIPAIIASVL